MTRIIPIDPLHPDPEKIQETVNLLKAGGVVAYPTETFYGLGADACNEAAIGKIFEVKGRGFNNPISVILGGREDLASWVAAVPAVAEKLMAQFWPGALTLVFEASDCLSPRLTAGTGKIAVRVSPHPIAAALAVNLAKPLTATSANLSGQAECVTAADVIDRLGDRLDAVIDGGTTPGGKGSTIIDITVHPFRVLREGVIPSASIHQTLV